MKSAAKKNNVVDFSAARLASNNKSCWAWIKDLLESPLPLGAKVVGTTINAHWINRKTGDCWVLHETIARKCGLTVSGVRRAIEQLVKAGFLKVESRGFKKANVYRLAMPTDRYRGSSESDTKSDDLTATVAHDTATTIALDRYRGSNLTATTVAAEPLSEPLTEPLNKPIESPSFVESQSATEPSLEANDGRESKRIDSQSSTDSVPAESPEGSAPCWFPGRAPPTPDETNEIMRKHWEEHVAKYGPAPPRAKWPRMKYLPGEEAACR